MSAVTPTNPLATAATQLQLLAGSNNEEERLFRDVARDVCSKPEYRNFNPDVIARFQTSQKPEVVISIFDELRGASRTWHARDSTSKSRKLASYAENILKFKDIWSTLADLNTIAKPVVGMSCAVLAMLAKVLTTDKNLDLVHRSLEAWFRHIHSVYIPGHPLTDDLRESIRLFYTDTIQFALNISKILQRDWKSFFRSITDVLDGELTDFLSKMDFSIKNITMSVHTDSRNDLKALRDAQAFPVQTSTRGQQNSPVTSARHYPDMLSRTFTGRQKELVALAKTLKGSQSLRPRKWALVGIGGVGKSQVALKYLHNFIDSHGNPGQSTAMFLRAHDQHTLLSEFAILAEKFRLGNSTLTEAQPEKLRAKVKEKLKDISGWLMVLDNVSDANYVHDFIPEEGNGQVIITTRSQRVANDFATAGNIVEINPFDPDDDAGVALVIRVAAIQTTPSILQQRAAREIVELAHGLPLAIEQFVKTAEREGLTWQKALQIYRNKISLLKQQNFCSSHEQNLSIGALVQITMDALDKKEPKALSLFRLLVYLNPSSISLDMLSDAHQKLSDHFARQWTYNIGSERQASVSNVPVPKRASKLKAIKGTYKNMFNAETDLPRVDTPADIELESFWNSQKGNIRAVLESRIHIGSAIDVLVDAGLVKRIDTATIWIHDLFAEMAQALVEDESRRASAVSIHFLSAIVYVTFPVPKFNSIDKSLKHLPHALAIHSQLLDNGLLNDTTIGPELCHLIASTLECGRYFLKQSEKSQHDTQVIQYYNQALTGYGLASDRLQRQPGVNMERIITSTNADYAREDISGSVLYRHFFDYERLGRSAPWRRINTCAKLGQICLGAGQTTEAIACFKIASRWYSDVFGPGFQDTLAYLDWLRTAYEREGEYQMAYDTTVERAKAFMFMTSSTKKHDLKRNTTEEPHVGLVSTEQGAGIAGALGALCSKIPGREKEAIAWYEVTFQAKKNICGERSEWCAPVMECLASAHQRVGNTDTSIYWRARSVEACLENMELNKYHQPGDEEYQRALFSDNEIAGMIHGLREVTADVSGLPDDTQNFVELVLIRARRWEELRDQQIADIEEARILDDQLFEAKWDRFDAWCVENPEVEKCSYDEQCQLYYEATGERMHERLVWELYK